LHAKNDVNDAPHLIEPLRVQVAGHLDVLMVLPGDLEGEARGREPYEPQPEVADRRAAAARLVESTMSVNMTVANTRSISASLRDPVRNSSVSSTTRSIISRSFQNA
jgi:hypothetical protein